MRQGFLIFIILMISLWIWNAVNFFNCDFDLAKSYKCEITHGIGLVTPLYIVTVWFDDDSSNKSNTK